MKLNQFDKQNLKEISSDLNIALQSVASKYGIDLRFGNMSFTELEVTVKLTGKIKDTDAVNSGNSWFLSAHGLPSNTIGQTFTYMKTQYTITGINMKSRKFPIEAKNLVSGSRAGFPSTLVKSLIAA